MSFRIDRRRLPPLATLTAFEAAARLGSFTEAARELNLTQGAISRQVKQLEHHVGQPLFDRARQRVHLNQAGRVLADQVRESLGHLLSVADLGEELDHGPYTLQVGVLPSYANAWLIPRLGDFAQRHPNIALNLVTTRRDFDYDKSSLDAAINLGIGAWQDAKAVRLAEEALVPIAVPAFAQQRGLKTARDLLRAPLLGQSGRPDLWDKWFAQNDVAVPRVALRFRFEHYSMLLTAVYQGLGVGLAPRLLVQDDIAAGRLVEFEGAPVIVSAGYYLVYPTFRETLAPLQSFKRWLQAQSAQATDG